MEQNNTAPEPDQRPRLWYQAHEEKFLRQPLSNLFARQLSRFAQCIHGTRILGIDTHHDIALCSLLTSEQIHAATAAEFAVSFEFLPEQITQFKEELFQALSEEFDKHYERAKKRYDQG